MPAKINTELYSQDKNYIWMLLYSFDLIQCHSFKCTFQLVCLNNILGQLTFFWQFTHPHVIQDIHVLLSSVAKKLRFLSKTFQGFSPYGLMQNRSQLAEGPNCSFSSASKALHQEWETGGPRAIHGPQCLLVRPAGLYYTRIINLKNIWKVSHVNIAFSLWC